jgi:ligand-binding SRPBCC domain-containing protein
MTEPKSFHSGEVKKSIVIKAPKENVWEKISKITELSWLNGVKKTVFRSKTKQGVGAIRKITFDDGNVVEEIIVGWKNEEYFSYIATRGLPLRAYHATISIKPLDKMTSQVTWQSFLNSDEMTKTQFSEFYNFMSSFYKDSLRNLKSSLEH